MDVVIDQEKECKDKAEKTLKVVINNSESETKK